MNNLEHPNPLEGQAGRGNPLPDEAGNGHHEMQDDAKERNPVDYLAFEEMKKHVGLNFTYCCCSKLFPCFPFC